MAYAVAPDCIGCGACESACPRAAISQHDGYIVTYVVDPLLCNDCGECVPPCPVDALAPDPAWPECRGRGCPLSSRRYGDWDCTEGEAFCPSCGEMMWRPPGGSWVCNRCRSGSGRRGAGCPKTRRVSAPVTAPGRDIPPGGTSVPVETRER